jgi:hypothetical protein
MENSETCESRALRRIASDFRASAAATDIVWFSIKMNDAANDLEVQAVRIENADAAYQTALEWRY